MKNLSRTHAIIFSLLALSPVGGCVSSRTFVLTPPAAGAGAGAVSGQLADRGVGAGLPEAPGVPSVPRLVLEMGPHTVDLPEDDRVEFERTLASEYAELTEELPPSGRTLTVKYRFVQLEDGHVPVRVVSGAANLFGSPFYGLGDGSVGVEATYLDHTGAELARIVTDGPISGAFASRGSGLDSAAESVAKYASMLVKPKS